METTHPKVALITGAAKRVGRTVALRLVQAGYDLAFTYLSSDDEAKALVEQIKQQGRRALAIRADLTDPAGAVAAIRERFAAAFDRLDVLVNNASLYEPSGLNIVTLEQSRRLMALHFESPLLLCQALAPILRSSRGHVINMVDLLAERPWPKYLAYCASKAALWNLTLGLARELAPEVTVNGIAPGVVEWAEGMSAQERQNYLSRIPLNRAGTPDDVAELVYFLATGGSYITGQIIRLDGGRSIM